MCYNKDMSGGATQFMIQHRYGMMPEMRLMVNAVADRVASEREVSFGLLSRPTGVRYPHPPHYFVEPPYRSSISHVTGVRGRHLSWRYPMRGPDLEGLLEDDVVSMGRPYAAPSYKIPGRLPAAVDYRTKVVAQPARFGMG